MTYYSLNLSILIISLTRCAAQFVLYNTDFITTDDLYYHCLYYKVSHDELRYSKWEKNHYNPTQWIPYCRRPSTKISENDTMEISGNQISEFSFKELNDKNISAQDLLIWSTSMDLVEQYQDYLNTLNLSMTFHNCTSGWFGPSCQYTFNLDQFSFRNVMKRIFDVKVDRQLVMDISPTITNLSCYMYLACNRRFLPLCLDWREICDGQVDCLDDGQDEIHCLQLEINECQENEYRCHNGMCIPKEFFNDNPYYPDCLDSSDEESFPVIDGTFLNTDDCVIDPGFRCEESDQSLSRRTLACGDGQYDARSLPRVNRCVNQRDSISQRWEGFSVAYSCWFLLTCLTYQTATLECQLLCKSNPPCSLTIQTRCKYSKYILFPVISLFPSHVRFGYWTNTTITISVPQQYLLPDFLCYDLQRCPFLPENFSLENSTCFTIAETNLTDLHALIQLFHSCLPVYQSGNITHCVHSSLYHCPNTSKCISKYRLLDGIRDCYDDSDEVYIDSCQLNDPYRFRCTSEIKCISRLLLHDGINHCRNGEDEIESRKQRFSYQNLCNGFIHFSTIWSNETDETHCLPWPCANSYTRCDGIWACSNGLDELNCDSTSPCYPDRHECVSPTTFQLICLTLDQVDNGNVDCLGATDERKLCRNTDMIIDWNSGFYRCWDNDTICTDGGCNRFSYCSVEESQSVNRACNSDERIQNALQSLYSDYRFQTSDDWEYLYFSLTKINRFTRTRSTNALYPAVSKQKNWIDFTRAWKCNRGVLVYMGIEQSQYCLCPPSYYGDRCQFQSERIGLTLQVNNECSPSCRGVYGIIATLIDDEQIIHSHEQFTYIPTDHCHIKYNLYLLYQSRPKNPLMNYTIHIDVYEGINLIYLASWKLPVQFNFLPVTRIASYLIIPTSPVQNFRHCPLNCGDHGQCWKYMNEETYFCRCRSHWFGSHCDIEKKICNCALDSICIGLINNRSICLCPLHKSGSRCLLPSTCQQNPCRNSARCVPDDHRLSLNTFTCICPMGYSGKMCEINDTRIEITFDDVNIPQSFWTYLITVRRNDDPLISAISTKIPIINDVATLFTSVEFNLIFIQIENEFYLIFLQINATRFVHLQVKIRSSDHCSPIDRLLDEETLKWPLLRRAKTYHLACERQIQLNCLYDIEGFMCLCNEDRYANCFPFDFTKTSACQRRTRCQNGGQCIEDLSTCPRSIMCICAECDYGSKCQFTTTGFRISLDVILGYHIRPHVSIPRQSIVVKVCIVLATLIALIGFLCGTLSVLTFQSSSCRQAASGHYLFIMSIVSLLFTVIFMLKFWLLIFLQITRLTSHHILLVNCLVGDFVIRFLQTIGDWLSACVAIERIIVIVQGVRFNKERSRKIARWLVFIIVFASILSFLHDPIHRQLVDDHDEQRTWCIVSYSSSMKIFDSMINVVHFILPFLINIISALMIIINIARSHSSAHHGQSYKQHLQQQFRQHQHLITSPIILVILSTPRLIISLISNCMRSDRKPWLFLLGYFTSMLPCLLTSIAFIIPSNTYVNELKMMIVFIRQMSTKKLRIETLYGYEHPNFLYEKYRQ